MTKRKPSKNAARLGRLRKFLERSPRYSRLAKKVGGEQVSGSSWPNPLAKSSGLSRPSATDTMRSQNREISRGT